MYPALQLLRQASSDIHAELELRMKLAAPNAGVSEYLTYLCAMRGWLAPFEHQLWLSEWPTTLQVSDRANKIAWIDADLRTAGMTDAAITALPLSSYVPPITSLPERFGVAYVIEGSQLGGQILRKRLAPSLKGWAPRWLEGYGDQTSSRWKKFCECLEDSLKTAEARALAATAARETFLSLAQWLYHRNAMTATVASQDSIGYREITEI